MFAFAISAAFFLSPSECFKQRWLLPHRNCRYFHFTRLQSSWPWKGSFGYTKLLVLKLWKWTKYRYAFYVETTTFRTWPCSNTLINSQLVLFSTPSTRISFPPKPFEVKVRLKPSNRIANNVYPSWFVKSELCRVEHVMMFEDENGFIDLLLSIHRWS